MSELLESIMARTVRPWPDCILWANAVDRGYGRISVDGKTYRVHRLVWEMRYGPIPDGQTVDHLCRVRNCVNAEHMELVTQGENTRRAAPYRPAKRWGRGSSSKRALSPACGRGHEFDAENTYIDRRGRRHCRACNRLRRRRQSQASAKSKAA